MKPHAYYNEIDPYAAAWLRELIKQGLIADGTVDTRSIAEVQPGDLSGYTQCHFFAGIGVWSHALRSAGWDDSRPVWTGSCPCQPFSAAGKQLGTADERHLWPVFGKLIAECKPPVVFGEQVASAAGRNWLATVRADLEALDYAVGAADLCAAGVHAPHIRQRLYWVADAGIAQREGVRVSSGVDTQAPRTGDGGASGGLADANDTRQQGDGLQPLRQGGHLGGEVASVAGLHATSGLADANGKNLWRGLGQRVVSSGETQRKAWERQRGWIDDGSSRSNGGLADAKGLGSAVRQPLHGELQRLGSDEERKPRGLADAGRSSADHGGWRAADWLLCRDGKWRPVEPGTFPLVDGATSRVGRLRAYGNAIVPQVAEAFIRAFLKCGDGSAER